MSRELSYAVVSNAFDSEGKESIVEELQKLGERINTTDTSSVVFEKTSSVSGDKTVTRIVVELNGEVEENEEVDLIDEIRKELGLPSSKIKGITNQRVLNEIKRIKQDSVNLSWIRYPDRMGQ